MLFLVFVCILLAFSSASNSELNVDTKDGTVIGNDLNGKVYSWLGIPFSASPVGALRWRPPVRGPGWYDTPLVASTPKICLQEYSTGWIGTEADCNNINVWKPANAKQGDQLLPVMVWIHGGDFIHSSPSVFVYNGTQVVEAGLANNQPVIVVSIQYRLGGLGFMGIPS